MSSAFGTIVVGNADLFVGGHLDELVVKKRVVLQKYQLCQVFFMFAPYFHTDRWFQLRDFTFQLFGL